MTHRAAGADRSVPRIWLLPIFALTVILGVTAGGVLSRSLLLDLLAWWPVWLAITLLTVLARRRQLGRMRLSGLIPLLASAALIAFTAGHVYGWMVMPSAAQELNGPLADSATVAALSAGVDGDLRVGEGASLLYEVGPVRRGGDIGIPEAVEQVRESAISIILQEPSDPGFHSFSGWDILLSAIPAWSLTLEGHIEADLSGLRMTGLVLSGDGLVTLGLVESSTPASVSGAFELVVPSGFPVRILGAATVPATWEQLSDGWRSPASGEGWVISVREGSSLSIAEG